MGGAPIMPLRGDVSFTTPIGGRYGARWIDVAAGSAAPGSAQMGRQVVREAA